MKLVYKAISGGGEMAEGTMEAFDQFALARELRGRGQTLISAKEAKNSSVHFMDALNEKMVRVRLKDKMVFASNLSAMLTAGLPISRALSVLERQTKNFKLKHVIGDIGTAINKGRSLHDALADYPKVFSSVFIAMVHAGEESGNLPQALSMVGTQLERTYTMRRKVRGALMYPAVIMIAMGCIGILMMIYVVPTLAATFSEFGKELPLSTRFILAISGFLVNHTFSFVISLFVIVILFWRLTKLSFFSRIIQFVTLRLPVIGNLVKEVNSAVAARTMGSLISAGVDMVRAITIGKEVVQNVYYKEVLDKAAEGVVKGEPLSTVFTKEEKLFPPLVGEMIEVGEETGKLTEMLLNVAVFYEAEVEAATKNMSTIIEPFLMLIIGGAVGFFAIAMIQPIYSLTAAM